MSHDWILDVLNDLREYSTRNGLNVLAAELGDVCATARAEIARPAIEGDPAPPAAMGRRPS